VTVLYLHPVGLDGRLWNGASVPDALTPSFPGFGDTPLGGRPTFELLVDFGELRGTGPVDVVGVSLGSMVAQHLAVRRPELVRSLLLACGASANSPEPALQRARDTRETGMAGVLDSTLERWFTAEALADKTHPGVAYATHRLLADDPAVFVQYWEEMATHDLRGSLGSLDIPVTVVAGAEDRAVSVPAMAAVAEEIPGARFEVVPGPHMLPLEDRASFAALVRRHLAEVAV
jgi:3-oxoadipate enol-lactonase